MSERLEQLLEKVVENKVWDEIYFREGKDNEGIHYFIFEDWQDHNKFVQFVIDNLELDDSWNDYDIEHEFDTNFVFSDEYSICDDCQSVIRTSPTHYGWQPDFYVGDGFIVCNECFIENGYAENYIQEKINQPKNAINGLVTETELQKMGFEKFNENSYESGFHYGQTDDPEKIYEELSDKYDEIVFFIDSTGQFDIHFSVWVRGEID